jgi:hypothetical protein
VSGCCNEYGCRRKKPLHLMRDDLTGTWYVVTAYTEHAVLRTPEGKPLYRVTTRHALEPFQQEQLEAMLEALRNQDADA